MSEFLNFDGVIMDTWRIVAKEEVGGDDFEAVQGSCPLSVLNKMNQVFQEIDDRVEANQRVDKDLVEGVSLEGPVEAADGSKHYLVCRVRGRLVPGANNSHF